MTDDAWIIRATADDARPIAEFLQSQDVRPAPRDSDVAAFTRRADAEVWYARRHDRIEGVIGCIKEGPIIRLAYLATVVEREDLLTRALVGRLEASAREAGAFALAAQAPQDSSLHRCLLAQGFTQEWVEGDAGAGKVVAVVDLVKTV